MRIRLVVVLAFAWATGPAPAFAQAPPEPKIWTVLASAGLAFTGGNTDTSTVNMAYEAAYDPPTPNVVKSDALWIRGKTGETITTSRLGVNIRNEYGLNARAFVFGQNQYLRDEFKSIEYLLAPTAGIGYRLFDTEQTKLDRGISLAASMSARMQLKVCSTRSRTGLPYRASRRATSPC